VSHPKSPHCQYDLILGKDVRKAWIYSVAIWSEDCPVSGGAVYAGRMHFLCVSSSLFLSFFFFLSLSSTPTPFSFLSLCQLSLLLSQNIAMERTTLQYVVFFKIHFNL
jgi:hypothetical protein